MRYTTFIVILCLVCQSVVGQTKGSFVGLSGGASFPVGQYASTNLEKGCFTMAGFNTGLEGAWYFKPYLGIGGQFGLNFHPVNVGALGYETWNNDPFMIDLTIRSEPYRVITGSFNIYSKWNFWKMLTLNGKLLVGMMYVKTPYQLYKPEYYILESEWYEITSSHDWNLSGGAGIGLQIDITDCIALKIDGEFYYSKMVFGFKTGQGTRYDHRVISFVNNTLALIIKL